MMGLPVRARVLFLVASLIAVNDAMGAALDTLVSFNHSNGANPYAGLIIDASGNLYGTTEGGGVGFGGTVFKIDASNNHALTTLTSFNWYNGASLREPLATDAAGNLYGSTEIGGPGENGTVFKLNASNNYALSTLTTSEDFNGPGSGRHAVGLRIDSAGDVYGMTKVGGANGYGTVFKLVASNNYAMATLHSFNFSNGAYPSGSLLADATGNLYGTTTQGGVNSYGTVFKLNAANSYALTTLTSFPGGFDGARPQAGLLADSTGNLYGTTAAGGYGSEDLGGGTVFKLDALNNYALTTLATFEDPGDGLDLLSNLVADAAGNLYGTTNLAGPGGFGTVFRLDASNNYAVSTLASFAGGNGANPKAGLVADSAGNLYGTTYGGGLYNYGTVFRISDTGFAVPEPSAMVVLACLAPAALARRRLPRATDGNLKKGELISFGPGREVSNIKAAG